MEIIYDKITKKYGIWVGKDLKNEEFLIEAYYKLPNGINHLVFRYKQFNLKIIKKDVAQHGNFSPRPYKLAQCCDGSIGNPVHAFFYNFCISKGVNPNDIYKEAYPDRNDVMDFKLIKKFAEWQGVEYPKRWGKREFQGLIESLTEINNHSLVDVLLERFNEQMKCSTI